MKKNYFLLTFLLLIFSIWNVLSASSVNKIIFDATKDEAVGNSDTGYGMIVKSPISFACSNGIISDKNNGHYRLYKNSKTTFSAEEGYLISKIEFECFEDYGPSGFGTENEGYSYIEMMGIWEGLSSIVSLKATSAQVRATNITVYYQSDGRAEANLVWSPSSAVLTAGDEFIVPKLQKPNSITAVTYQTNNAAVATVTAEGVIALAGGIGTATITATFGGDANYKPATATCTITVNEYIEVLGGKWQLVTDASKLRAGMEIVIANVATNGVVKTMAKQKENNRGGVTSYVTGDILTPTVETSVITLEDCQSIAPGLFALKTKEGYLYAASSSSNELKSQNIINGDACWEITIKDGVASIVAEYSSNNRNFMRYNTTNELFSCYESGKQKDLTIYARILDFVRDVTPGYYGTICVPYGSDKYSGAEFYEVSSLVVGQGLWLDQLAEGTPLEAGKPYIFKATTSELTIIADGTTVDAPQIGANGLTGTFTDIAAGGNLVDNYIIAENKVWVAGTGATLPANRAYINSSSVPTTPQAQIPGRRRVCMGENAATGFDNITTGENHTIKFIENGQLIIIRDGVKYNAQGQRLSVINYE